MKPRKRRKFTAAFKQEVVELCLRDERSISAISRDLDLSESSVRRWVEQNEIDCHRGPEGAMSTTENAEIKQLRREVRRLREERDILKKAAAFFAKENT